jgi:anti-sigma B factor antagonist
MNLVMVSQEKGRVPVTVLHLQDLVTQGNMAEVEQAARQAFAAGARDMVMDLTKAPAISSAGIRLMMVIHNMLGENRKDKTRHLKLVSPTPHVKDVLELTGLLEYLEVFPSLELAVASF